MLTPIRITQFEVFGFAILRDLLTSAEIASADGGFDTGLAEPKRPLNSSIGYFLAPTTADEEDIVRQIASDEAGLVAAFPFLLDSSNFSNLTRPAFH